MVQIRCENRGCRLCDRHGECTATQIQVVFDADGYLKVDCPEITVRND